MSGNQVGVFIGYERRFEEMFSDFARRAYELQIADFHRHWRSQVAEDTRWEDDGGALIPVPQFYWGPPLAL